MASVTQRYIKFDLTTGKYVRGDTAADEAKFAAVGINTIELSSSSGNLSVGSVRIVNVADPVGAQDVATKSYVDALEAGLDFKDSVHIATTDDLATLGYPYTTSGTKDTKTLTGTTNVELVLDGDPHPLVAGERVLVKDEGDGNAEVTDFDFTSATVTTGKYFLINSAYDNFQYYVWFNVNSGGGDPTVAGREGIEVAVPAAPTPTQLASAAVTAINTIAGSYFTANSTGAVLTVTNDRGGDTTNATAGDISGLSVTVTTAGTGNAEHNGIYVVIDPGETGVSPWILDRSEDTNGVPGNEVSGGMYVFVEHGTLNANSAFVLSNVGVVDVDVNSQDFVQFSGAGQIDAGNGLNKSGNTLSVNTGNGIEIVGDAVAVDVEGTNPTLEFSSNALKVKYDSANFTQSSNGLDIATGGINTTELANTSVTNGKLNVDVAGNGITGGAGSALAVNRDTARTTPASNVNASGLGLSASGLYWGHKMYENLDVNDSIITSSVTNGDVVITPNGTGSLLRQKPDSDIPGGNARGANAVDFQISRISADQVASGTKAVIITGSNNKASGTGAVVIGGVGNSVNSSRGIIISGSSNTIANATDSVLMHGTTNTISHASTANAILLNGTSNAIGSASFTAARSFIGTGATNVIGSTANADDSVILAGSSNTINATFGFIANGSTQTVSAQGGTILAGTNNTVSAANGVVLSGFYNTVSHGGGIALGRGAQTSAIRDFVIGADGSATSSSVNNVGFRIAGDTSSVHIGRSSGATASTGNKLYLYSTDNGNVGKHFSLQSPTNPAGNYNYIFPSDTPAVGESLRVTSVGGSDVGLEWATPVSTLATLTDVNVASVADGDILVYSSTAGKWVDADLGNGLTWDTGVLGSEFISVELDTDSGLAFNGSSPSGKLRWEHKMYQNLNVNNNAITTSVINGNIGLIPNGNGAIVAKDITTARGTKSVDLQIGGTGLNLGLYSTISGGLSNNISAPVQYGVIGGGVTNEILAVSGSYGMGNFIGGGNSNIITAETVDNSIKYSSIVGGESNTITAVDMNNDQSLYATILGGRNNAITDSQYSVILGGDGNTSQKNNDYSLIFGQSNTINKPLLADNPDDIHRHNIVVIGRNNIVGTASAINDVTIIGRDNQVANAIDSSLIMGRGADVASGWGTGSLVVGNKPGAGGPSSANVHFRVEGANSNLHVGRTVDQSAVSGAANTVFLHTVEASNQSKYVGFKAPASGLTSYTLTMPTTSGTSNQVLQTDGTGVLSWASISASLSGLTDVNTTGAADGNLLMYDSSLSKWVDASVGTGLSVTTTDGSQSIQADYTKTYTNNSGASISSGDVVVINSTGEIYKADASSGASSSAKADIDKIVGVAAEAIANTASGKVYVRRGAIVSGFTGLDEGKRVYVSKTAGGYTQDISAYTAGDQVYSVGRADSTSTVILDSQFIIEL